MTDTLNRHAKLIMGFLSFLLAFTVFIASWSRYESSQTAKDLVKLERTLPEMYVTYRQYACDMERMEKLLGRIETKLDRYISGAKYEN